MPLIVLAIAVAVVIVIGVCFVFISRSRRDDEGEQFRRVADLTSRWSRQVQKVEPSTPVSERQASTKTESVDPS